MGRKGFHILNDDILHILLHIDYGIFCLVRKSVDCQIQHFLVKCVKKTKILGRISDFGNQCLAQQRKKFQSD